MSERQNLLNGDLDAKLFDWLRDATWGENKSLTLPVTEVASEGAKALGVSPVEAVEALRRLYGDGLVRFPHTDSPNWALDSDDIFFVKID